MAAPSLLKLHNGSADTHDSSRPGEPDTTGSRPRTTTRANLIERLSESGPGCSRSDARDILEAALDEISDALLRGDPVKLRSFGLFTVRAKRERLGRNPRTGVEAAITPRRVLTFRPSPVLVERIAQTADASVSAPDRPKSSRAGN